METVLNYRQTRPEIRTAKDNERKFTFVASDGTRDAAGTVLNVKGWKLDRFNANGVIGYQHNVYGNNDGCDPDDVIGKGHAYVRNGKLMVDVELEPAEINPNAEKIFKKLKFGSLNAVSVGFAPIGRGKWGTGEEARTGSRPTYYYAGQELLEVSVVNIPANSNALVQRSLNAEHRRLQFEPLTATAEAAVTKAKMYIAMARAALAMKI